MSDKDDFIAYQNHQNDKISFALNSEGHIVYIVKRVDKRLFDVFSRLQRLRCVNLPLILDVIQRDDCLEIHEEYIRGRTVEQLMQNGVLDDDTLLCVAEDVCRALMAIHGTEPPIVHRDIKPENIMQREDGGYVLIDFDAARLYREAADMDTQCIVTVGYAAPERYGLSQTDVRSDLFSLGVTLYELKTGESYHMGATCGGLLGKTIAKCTAFEPRKRFRNAEQLYKRLESLHLQHSSKTNGLRVLIAALGCLVIAAIAVTIWFAAKTARTEAQLAAAYAAMQTEAPAVVSADVGQSDQECTCELLDPVLTADDGLIVPFYGDEPVTVSLRADGEFRRYDCYAAEHIQTVGLVACCIDDSSIGASAEITDDGVVTIYAQGVYMVSGFTQIAGETGDYIKAILIATANPAAYTDCECVLDIGRQASGLSLSNGGSGSQMPLDGSQFVAQMYIYTVIESRICDASQHLELWTMHGYVDGAPEGADCDVTGDNFFYTDTPGIYELRLQAFYGDEIINFGCEYTVD